MVQVSEHLGGSMLCLKLGAGSERRAETGVWGGGCGRGGGLDE